MSSVQLDKHEINLISVKQIVLPCGGAGNRVRNENQIVRCTGVLLVRA